MGLFDQMIGKVGEGMHGDANANQKFNELKGKYSSVLQTVEQQQVRLQNLHVQDGKLFIRGTAPSDQAKNLVWDAIKKVDSSYADLSAEFTVGADAGGQTAASTTQQAGAPSKRSYTVKQGDTLSHIAKDFYGDAKAYDRIFQANRNVLTDPNLIRPGQTLVIP